jgi:hypothetical protein
MTRFRQEALSASDRQGVAQAMGSSIGSWPSRMPPTGSSTNCGNTAAEIDLQAFAAEGDRLVPAARRESRGYPAYEAAAVLENRVGRELLELPGGHLGFSTQRREFAQALLEGVGHVAARE